jgi:membrane-bound lytic murein transglycosylase A
MPSRPIISLKFFLAFFCVFALSGCFFHKRISLKGQGNLRLHQIDFSELSGWENDDHKKALQSFIHSCDKFAKMAQKRRIGNQIGNIVAEDFHDVCDIAEVVKTMDNKQAKNFFENWFKAFRVEGKNGSSGTFTGYYEASLEGSRRKTSEFKYPIYAKPQDLGTEAYLTRAEIEDGALSNKGLELLYVNDKVDLFFMHTQGSGVVKLPDGSLVKVAFAARNNQPFLGVGNYMVENGLLARENLNAATVRAWLKANPEKADEIMNINNSYVFFKISDNENVIGAQGVPLAAERSLAVDSDIMPYGFPMWVDTAQKHKDGSKTKFQKLMIAQDTGSAIKGVVRGDIFFGRGDEAEENASYMASQGSYYILIPANAVR